MVSSISINSRPLYLTVTSLQLLHQNVRPHLPLSSSGHSFRFEFACLYQTHQCKCQPLSVPSFERSCQSGIHVCRSFDFDIFDAYFAFSARSGTDISFLGLFLAVQYVYNLSFPLAFFLTFFGFFTCGELSWHPLKCIQDSSEPKGVIQSFIPTWKINLASLSKRGSSKIAHDASLVHPDDKPSTSPDPTLLSDLLRFASHANGTPGLTLHDLARLHVKREAASNRHLNCLHEQVALGECGLTWLVLRGHTSGFKWCSLHPHRERACETESVIPLSRLEQWFGEERLPDDWWESVRPVDKVGLRETRRRAKRVARVACVA
jgi:Peroxidase, family 2